MNWRFESYWLLVSSSTAFLKLTRSIAQKEHSSRVLIEADLGALYSNASSPKLSPGLIFLRTCSLIITWQDPLSNDFYKEKCWEIQWKHTQNEKAAGVISLLKKEGVCMCLAIEKLIHDALPVLLD